MSETSFNALQSIFIEKGFCNFSIAKAALISPATLSSRLHGKTAFTAPEMASIGDFLDIPPAAYYTYFIEPYLSHHKIEFSERSVSL